MTGLWTKLKQRKLVQWTLAYVAFAFALLQAVDIVATRFGWPALVEKIVILALCVGLVLTLVLAWYHGEQGRQRVSGIELIILAVVLAVGGGFLWQFTRTPAPKPPASAQPAVAASGHAPAAVSSVAVAAPASADIPPKSIAVLPFDNLSADKNNAYFADGMQDMILTKLADIGGLRVMSRTATLKYRSHPDNLGSIARQLRVATFLEGSVQKAGNQVLINVQLIDARSGSHLWAQAYKRNLNDIFGVEGEVAQKIAAALNSKLSPTEQRDVAVVPTRNPDAFDAYLRGKHDVDTWIAENDYKLLPAALKSFQRAVRLDPDFALAWAGLANVQLVEIYGTDHPKAMLRDAEANARRALTLAPRLPEAHYAMALVQLYGHQDDREARSQLQQALSLRPSYADAVGLLAQVEFENEGDLDGGITQFRRAVALDPNSASAALDLARALSIRGNYATARTMARRAIALAPNNTYAYVLLGDTYFYQSGNVAAVLKELDRIPAAAPNRLSVNVWRTQYLVMQRDFAAARRAAAKIPQGKMESEIADNFRGYVEWFAGDRDAARPYLQKADNAMRGRIARMPEGLGPYAAHAMVLAMLGDKKHALRQIHKAMRIDRQKAQGRATFTYVMDLRKLAEIQAITGDRDGAIGTLQKIIASNFPLVLPPAELRVNPVWDPLRSDPRFQALLKHLAARKPLPLPGADS